MLTHLGPGAFFLSEWFFPSFIAFARNVGVTTLHAPRSHARRAVGSSCSAASDLASESSPKVRVTLGVSSTGRFSSCARAHGLTMVVERATTNPRAALSQETVLI